MASSSNTSANFPAKKLIVSKLTHTECIAELVELQELQLRSDGETFFEPQMFHLDEPFMSCFQLPVKGEFPTYSLHMLWWLCYMHYIPFEFSLDEWCNSLSAGGIPKLVQEFMEWFMPENQWNMLFSRELWNNRRANGSNQKSNAIIFLKWSDMIPSYEFFRTYPFSLVEKWNQREKEVDVLQKCSATMNNYCEYSNVNRHRSNAPWKMFPAYYTKVVEESREIWELLQGVDVEMEREEIDRRNYERWLEDEDVSPHMNDSPEIAS